MTVHLTHAQADTAYGIARVEFQAATRELEAASLPHEALHTAYGQATTRCDRCVRAFIARTRLVDARALVDALEAQKEEDY